MNKKTRMLHRERAFYAKHRAEYRKKYPHKWLIIADGTLFGVYDTIRDAVTAAQKCFKNDDFLLHRPIDDDATLEVGPMGVIHRHRPYETRKPATKTAITATKGKLLHIPHA
jgi:hypothetical protein